MAKSSLFICFERVVKAINTIATNIIRWPNEHERAIDEREFYKLGHIPGCVGAIDGTYVPIKAPSEKAQVYVNRKCFYAVTLQCICNSQRKILDVFCGYPSSVSDARIFQNSDITKDIIANSDEYFNRQFIIGDKAYPLYSWCIPPFIDRGNLEPFQLHFNTQHARTRQVVERTFALLFGRFRRLKYLDINKTEFIPAVVLACCVLHNICLQNNDGLPDHILREGEVFVNNQNPQGENDEEYYGGAIRNGGDIRERIARDLYTEL